MTQLHIAALEQRRSFVRADTVCWCDVGTEAMQVLEGMAGQGSFELQAASYCAR